MILNTDVHVIPNEITYAWIYINVGVNTNLGRPAKVKCEGKSMELYGDKAGPPIVRLLISGPL